eukprot:scaffold305889_cov36-Tisochrysis_lutea.AAC.1
MVEGTDAAALTERLQNEAAVAAFERNTHSRLYRGWPLVEVEDARRCFQSTPAHASDATAWLAYEQACQRAWRSDRARLYIDFFHRHLTAGDVGAALSHLRVAEDAVLEKAQLTLVLEDDCKLTPNAITSVIVEVDRLSSLGIDWDLIYLHSAKYGRRGEPFVHPSSALRVAGHRKVCHAYLLSQRGASKLAASGFRDCLFPVDDFLPALHAGHPREDIMALPCVRRARGELHAVASTSGATSPCLGAASEGQDHDGVAISLRSSGFVALTFPDDAGLVRLPGEACTASSTKQVGVRRILDSDSKAGSGSKVLLGDAGVSTCAAESDDENDDGLGVDDQETLVSSIAADDRILHDVSVSLGPPIDLKGLLWAVRRVSSNFAQPTGRPTEAAELRHQLCSKGYARLRLPTHDHISRPRHNSHLADHPDTARRDDGSSLRCAACDDDPDGRGSNTVERVENEFNAKRASTRVLDVEELVRHGLVHLLRAEEASLAFFGMPLSFKRRCAGTGGRKGELMLWSCGFSQWPQRQHWHLVCGAFDEAQAWPEFPEVDGVAQTERNDSHIRQQAEGLRATGNNVMDHCRNASTLRPSLRAAECVLRSCALACLNASVLRDGGATIRACETVPEGNDPSVLDSFLYAEAMKGLSDEMSASSFRQRMAELSCAPSASEPHEVHMIDHVDPGLLTLTRRSDAAGLEVWDVQSEGWVALEQLAAPNDVLVFAGEQMQALSGGAIPAVRHRVLAPREQGVKRCSVVFELRLPEATMMRRTLT